MNYLLDTHALIWSVTDIRKLSPVVIEIMENPKNNLYVSALSFWEISLKFSLGKLHLQGISPEDFPGLVSKMKFETMALEVSEAATYHQIGNAHHRDPFDRMLIWQAIQNNLVLITKDENMPPYTSKGLQMIW